jgi:hypothetical protein
VKAKWRRGVFIAFTEGAVDDDLGMTAVVGQQGLETVTKGFAVGFL